jgi:hypothetical protein
MPALRRLDVSSCGVDELRLPACLGSLSQLAASSMPRVRPMLPAQLGYSALCCTYALGWAGGLPPASSACQPKLTAAALLPAPQLQHIPPDAFQMLQQLQQLRLQGNTALQRLPPTVAALPALRQLHVAGSAVVTAHTAAALAACLQLEQLEACCQGLEAAVQLAACCSRAQVRAAAGSAQSPITRRVLIAAG